LLCIVIADHHRDVQVPVELHNDLLIQPALVVLDRQEQVGVLLSGELINAVEVCSASAWISTLSSSSVLSKAFRAARSWDAPVSKDIWAIVTPITRAWSVTWVTNRVARSGLHRAEQLDKLLVPASQQHSSLC
jgi:hypothetical protein